MHIFLSFFIFIFSTVGDRSDYSNASSSFTVTAGTVFVYDNISSKIRGQEQLPKPETVKVSRIVIHPETTILLGGGVDWDIALLQLEKDLTKSDLVQPICLPTQAQVFKPGSFCYLAGWGFLSFRQGKFNTSGFFLKEWVLFQR